MSSNANHDKMKQFNLRDLRLQSSELFLDITFNRGGCGYQPLGLALFAIRRCIDHLGFSFVSLIIPHGVF